LASEK
jgi:hypothetical protein